MNRSIHYFLTIAPDKAASSLLVLSLLMGVLIKTIGWLAGQILTQDLFSILILSIPLLFLAYKIRKTSKLAIVIYILLAFCMPFYLTEVHFTNSYSLTDYWQSMILNLIGAIWALKSLFKSTWQEGRFQSRETASVDNQRSLFNSWLFNRYGLFNITYIMRNKCYRNLAI